MSDFSTRGLSTQLAKADKLGLARVVILGEDELKNQAVLIRDLKSGDQANVKISELADHLKA